jgi:hypothetical protein
MSGIGDWNNRVFKSDAHSACGEYVAEGSSGVSLGCLRQAVGQTITLVARQRDRLGSTMPSCECPAGVFERKELFARDSTWPVQSVGVQYPRGW